ncbi:MAG: GPR endopeptidase [Bacilli bacterium]|nr:GPR endopeptidase [Bacilli bacterium]
MNIFTNRTDLYFEKKNLKYLHDNISLHKEIENNYLYHTIYFPNSFNSKNLINILKNELIFFINNCDIHNFSHILVVGLGNKLHTADSVGPEVLKYLNITSHLNLFNIDNKIKISAIEPGVLSTTGIPTDKIVKSIADKIKPDLLILIDAYVTNNIDNLNHTIEITNEGIIPGSGIKGINNAINKEILNIPTISIGVPTAIEIKLNSKKKDNEFTYLLSTNSIDSYISNISRIIAYSLNETFNNFNA